MAQASKLTAEEVSEVAARFADSVEHLGAAFVLAGQGFKQAAEAIRQLPAGEIRELLKHAERGAKR